MGEREISGEIGGEGRGNSGLRTRVDATATPLDRAGEELTSARWWGPERHRDGSEAASHGEGARKPDEDTANGLGHLSGDLEEAEAKRIELHAGELRCNLLGDGSQCVH